MIGNGQETPPPDTSSLWGDVFGIGSLFKVISDPGLMQHTHAMIAAVIEGANSNRRIEAKLDRLLKALGHEIDDINGRWPSGLSPALLTQQRTDGGGGIAPASLAVDDGTGGAARGFDESRGRARDDRGDA